MIIKKNQMASFLQRDNEIFIIQLKEWIIGEYSEKVWCLSPLDLDVKIRKTIKEALLFNINMEDNIAWLVDFTFQIQESFYQKLNYEWAKDILSDLSLHENEKILKIKRIIYPE